jgi:hypothetical protein
MAEKRHVITRRDFLRAGACAAVGSAIGLPLIGKAASAAAGQSRVVLIRHDGVVEASGNVRPDILAAMLDAVASGAADRLTQLLAARFPAAPDGGDGRGRVTLGYSPGYCGWHVSGQRALFAYLGADAIGVTVNESCLMHPLKSVSGVLAAGPPGIHRFTPGYEFCTDCRNRTCLGRLQRLFDETSSG